MLRKYPLPLDVYNLPISDYTSVKSPLSYSNNLIKNMKMISIFETELPTPFGSFIYSSQKYPGDIDLIQDFSGCCDAEYVISVFIHNLKIIVRDIITAPVHYMSEFKAGIDEDYLYYIGNLSNGHWKPSKNLQQKVNELYLNNLFNEREASSIIYILENKIFDDHGYDVVYNIFRERMILRWSGDEI